MVSLSKHLKQGNALNKTIKDLVWLLYDTALLNSGFSLEQPKEFSNRIHNLIELGLDNNDETEDNINIENTVEEYGVEEEVEDDLPARRQIGRRSRSPSLGTASSSCSRSCSSQ